MINVGVVGYGYWGPNLVRNFSEHDECRVRAVCDSDPRRCLLVRKRYPLVKAVTSWIDVVRDPEIDVIAVSTPVSTHFEIGMAALRAGKHVWMEKPLACTTEECARLIDAAEGLGRVLIVDHTFIYTSAVQKIHELVQNGMIGEVLYYDSVRVNLGLFQHDVNVIWDLAVHDLAILRYLTSADPVAVSVTGVSHVVGQPENMAHLTLFFESKLVAHIQVNWLAPVKVRNTIVGGSRKMIVYDDLQPSEKVKVYDCGVSLSCGSETVDELLIGYRTGDIWVPRLDTTEALKTGIRHLVDCLTTGQSPITDGRAGLDIVHILEVGTKSMRELGRPVELAVVERT